MSLINIAASVILILLGMRHLRKGLDRLFGNRLLEWLQQATASRWKAFTAGIVAGTVAPSSTSIALLSVQMLSRAALPAGRLLAVVLGANVGITVTVQLLSFHLENGAAALLIAGGVAFLFLQRPIFRGVGQVLLAFGLIFLAMQWIGASDGAIAQSGDLAAILKLFESQPWALFAATAILTVVLQSSTASLALGIGLAQGGLLVPSAMVAWVVGANVGIAITSLIAGWTSVEGRRLGTGNLLLKGVGAVAALLVFPFLEDWLRAHVHLPVYRAAADFHTGFNLFLGLAALPFLRQLSGIMSFLVESPPEGAGAPESYLDPLLLQSPSLALNQCAREEFRMMDELKAMLRAVQAVGEEKNPAKLSVEVIGYHRKRVESIAERLKSYLGGISDDSLSAADVKWKIILLNYIQELAAVSILIHRDLSDSIRRQAKGGAPMPAGEQQDIATLCKRTLERMERAISILMNQVAAQAEAFIAEKEQISHWCRRAQLVHLERQTPAGAASSGATSDYLDQLNCLRRINSHITSAAYALARPQSAPPETSVSLEASEEK